MKLVVAHPGTQHSPRLAKELHQRHSLLRFCTSLSFGDKSLLANFFSYRMQMRRTIQSVPAESISLQPWLELSTLFLKMGMDSRSVFLARNKYFQRGITSSLLKEAEAIIGFDTSSWVLAGRARKLSKRFFVEMTTPHPAEKEKILDLLFERYPAWMGKTKKVSGKRVEDEEASSAFHVVVPSSYVKQGYVANGVADEKITVNPYGVDTTDFSLKKFEVRQKVRFLFLGAINASKGVPFLLEAWKKADVSRAELMIAGYGALPPGVPVPPGVTMLGRIEGKDRVKLLHSCDVFICPSFYEGLALVQLEAAFCGLPVIGTTSSGAGDVLTEGKSGFIVEPGSIDKLSEKINFFAAHPEAIEPMGMAAHHAVARYTWQAYADRWLSLIREMT